MRNLPPLKFARSPIWEEDPDSESPVPLEQPEPSTAGPRQEEREPSTTGPEEEEPEP